MATVERAALVQAVNNVIVANGRQQITGPVLNNILIDFAESLLSLLTDDSDNVREGTTNRFANQDAVHAAMLEVLTRGGNIRFVNDPQNNQLQLRVDPPKVWAAADTYFNSNMVSHSGALWIRQNVEGTAGAMDADEPGGTEEQARSDADKKWFLLLRPTGGGGGQPQPGFDTPSIAGFSLTGIDLDDGSAAGDVRIQAAISHPNNIRGNTPGGSANNAIGIEWSTDGNTYTSITSTVRQTITKDGLQQGLTITLPANNPLIAAGGSLYIRLFAYTTEATPSRIVSNALLFRRAQAHEYIYAWGVASRDDLVYANYDITAYDQRADVSANTYDVSLVIAGVPTGNYVMVFVPGNREPTEIRDTLGVRLTIGTDITRVANARTIGGQAYTAFYVHHTDSLTGEYDWRFIRN